MKLKSLFFILFLLQFIICLFCVYTIFKLGRVSDAHGIVEMLITGRNGYLLVMELLFVVLIIYLLFFYKKAIMPYRIIGNGMDLIKGQDFGSKLRRVGQYDADKIVELFNSQMNALKNERLHVRENNQFLDLLVNVSPMGLIMMDFDRVITSCNDSAIKFLNDEESQIVSFNGEKLSEIETALGRAIATLEVGETATFRIGNSKICRCSFLFFIDHGFKHPFVLIESLTAEILETERETYSKVIKMVAHEVNNTVAGITSTLDSIDDSMKGDESGEKIRALIKICSNRSMEMSKFVTNFADVVKIPEPQLKRMDLNLEIPGIKLFMENLCIKSGTKLNLILSDSPFMVMLDNTMFELVLVNMLKNAVESSATMIDISTDINSRVLVVTDNGKGISEENVPKLFSPFFSTKPHGQGLGLIMIKEILMKHNCTFSLKTKDDGFTRFIVKFPDNV